MWFNLGHVFLALGNPQQATEMYKSCAKRIKQYVEAVMCGHSVNLIVLHLHYHLLHLSTPVIHVYTPYIHIYNTHLTHL